MNRMKKLLALLLAALMLTACGGDPAESGTSDGSAGAEATEPAATETQDQTVQGDTWGAANGMSGYVEYQYDEEGREIERRLINGATGTLYRRFTSTYGEEFLGEGYAPTRTVETYGPNNILMYTVLEYYFQDGKLAHSSGYDPFREEYTITQSFGDSSYTTSEKMHNYFSEIYSFWIDHYGPHGLESRDYHWKDGTIYIRETYDYDDKVGHWMTYESVRGDYVRCEPEFNDQGQVIAYWELTFDGAGGVEKKHPRWEFEYDDQGRLTKKIGYASHGGMQNYQKLTYGEDGSLIQCELYISSHSRSYQFVYEDGFLVYQHGSDCDWDDVEYCYYPSGVMKAMLGDENSLYSGSIYYFAEDGTLCASGTYERHSRSITYLAPDGTELSNYYWAEGTDSEEGIFRSWQYTYPEDGSTDSEDTSPRRIEEVYLDPVPMENEFEFVVDFLDTHRPEA